MNELKIAYIQTELYWEDRNKNLLNLSRKINQIDEQIDLIVLPEMFSTGFTMNAQSVADTMGGSCVNWMREHAKNKNAVVAGSIAITESNKFFNRFIWMNPDGTFTYYDKRHLFQMADEHKHYQAGKKKVIVELKNWKVLLQVCYDLRFPVWSRRRSDIESENYEVILYVANWPERRRHAWNILLQARAIENQCYVLGVNRVGKDGNNNTYSGDSKMVDFLGNSISTTNENEDMTEIISIHFDALEQFRSSFPAASDADNFEIK